jgi:4-amino-4-deoxy-L-arabinose transferase-like glycosyltransferase
MALPALVLPVSYFAYLGFHVDNAYTLWGNEMVQGDGIPIWKRPLRFYYPAILFVGLAPWLIVFATTLKDIWSRRENAILILACGVLVSVCLVSFAGKLRPQYLLPVMPICAAVMAWSLLNVGKSLHANTVQPLKFKILAWSQFALVGVFLVALLVTLVKQNEDDSNKLNLIYAALPWLVVSAAFYATAAIAASRNITVSAVVLIASILCTFGAFARMQIDDSESSQSAYRFVMQVEAYLSTDAQLYLNSDRLLQFYYYSSATPEIRSLENWQGSDEREGNTFFIVRMDILKKNAWPGETVMLQTQESEDRAMVLFRPAKQQ